ncbi:hypothetical protein EJ05DRAFT_487048 [Pseudovirgaria hyperparasitica]|uniref:NTF2 domain-containing protein n=1 Tax=Pseudovirgaria hyperparasitica TaxID=470096 RepID=A0A6A6W2A7_9PEZI|nr:uncharacterized protein EJ05DRAFT_487048 [Pseudovirgaria hyperparasitica]KAF2757058.1 hypothetical protein EJ05DRAFT_487048 [Pseudovirgaria hyperparasitica]
MSEEAVETQAVKVATEAAEAFTDAFYTALQGSRHTLADYYIPHQTLPDGKIVPKIAWNGNVLHDGPAVQTFFENEMPFTHYQVHSLNCHILKVAPIQPPPTNPRDVERNFSIIITVNGDVRLEEATKGPLRGFAESFVMVPNTNPKVGHSWVIQAQNFRYVV